MNLKRTSKRRSPIHRSIDYAKDLFPSIQPMKIYTKNEPWWLLKKESFILDLQKYEKQSTSPFVYQQEFKYIRYSFTYNSWKFLYTDGSKTNTYTSFGIVDDNHSPITYGLLEPYCSIFTAEALAIKLASEYASKQKGRFVICTDSKSTISALLNVKYSEPLIVYIRRILIKFPNKMRIMWVPGHSGIAGNEAADETAGIAAQSPVFTFTTHALKDFTRLISDHLNVNKTFGPATIIDINQLIQLELNLFILNQALGKNSLFS